jgi:hypothetical protein
MAKGDSNAAKKLDAEAPAPQASGTEVMTAEEVDALLAQMTETNAEADWSGEEGATEEVPAPAAEAEDTVENAAPAEPSTTSFTMEDILKAASEATSLSTDEILSYEASKEESAPEPEPTAEPADTTVVELFGSKKEPIADAPAKAEVAAEPSAIAEKPARKLPQFAVPASLSKVKPYAGVIGGVLVVVAAFGVAKLSGGANPALAQRQAKLEKTVGDIEEQLQTQNQKLGQIEAAILAAKGAEDHGNGKPQGGASESHGHAAADAQGHGAKSNHAKPTGHGQAGHAEDSHAKKPAAESHHGEDHAKASAGHHDDGHAKGKQPERQAKDLKAEHHAAKAAAGIEGFEFSKDAHAPNTLIFAGEHGKLRHPVSSSKKRKPVRRSSKASAPAKSAIRVYLNGKRIN